MGRFKSISFLLTCELEDCVGCQDRYGLNSSCISVIFGSARIQLPSPRFLVSCLTSVSFPVSDILYNYPFSCCAPPRTPPSFHYFTFGEAITPRMHYSNYYVMTCPKSRDLSSPDLSFLAKTLPRNYTLPKNILVHPRYGRRIKEKIKKNKKKKKKKN